MVLMATTGAVDTGAARAALALAIILSCWNVHDNSLHIAAGNKPLKLLLSQCLKA